MKVVIVNDFAYVNGGASSVAVASAAALARSGVDVVFFAAVGEPAAELAQSGVKTVTLGQSEIAADKNRLRAALQGLWNIRAASELGALLGGSRKDDTIVHIHSWTKSLSSCVARVALGRGFRVVLTLHDYFTACPNGGFYNYPQDCVCRLRPLSAACLTEDCDSRRYSHHLWRVLRQVVQERAGLLPRGIGHFIAVSKFSRDILKPFLPPAAQVQVLANPVAADQGGPAPVAENDRFLFVGRQTPEKGPLLLADALSKLRARAIFAGDGPLKRAVQERCPSAEMPGWLDRAALRIQIRRALALVLPSLWYETQGLVVLECAASGVPAIVPDLCAASEFVEHGRTGLIFKRGDKADLADKMRSLLADRALAARLGRAAYEKFWAAPPSAQAHAAGLLDIYRQMLSR